MDTTEAITADELADQPLPRPKRNGNNASWTEERMVALVAMLKGDLPTSAIVRGLNAITPAAGGLTRNSVVGKVHRENMSDLWPRSIRARQQRAEAQTRRPFQSWHDAAIKAERDRIIGEQREERKRDRLRAMCALKSSLDREAREDRARALQDALNKETSPFACTFEELDRHHCRWPLGEPGTPEFRYCGAERMNGKVLYQDGRVVLQQSSYCTAHHIRSRGAR